MPWAGRRVGVTEWAGADEDHPESPVVTHELPL